MNKSRRHMTDRTLAEYLTGELSLLTRVELESHVAVCPRCAEKLAAMEKLIVKMRADASQNTLSSIIDRAVRSFQSKKARLPAFPELPRRVLAVLRFDSAGLAPVFGIRSGLPGARQLLYSAGADEIDLRIEPADQGWTVSGQILGRSSAGGRVILEDETGKRETSLNELNEFVFMPVPAGAYRLALKLKESEIEIEEIVIGS